MLLNFRGAGRLRRCFALLCLLLALGACSSRFAYNHADFFIAWYVDDYLDFSRSQKKAFKQLVKEQQVWHRATQLPLYQQQLKSLIAKVEANEVLDEAFMRWQSEQIKAFIRLILRQALPDMQQLLQGLSDKQIEHFIDELKAEQKKQEKAFAKQDRQDILTERQTEMRAAFKRWFGSVNKEQKWLIELWSTQLLDIYGESLELKRAWLSEVGSLMRQGRTEANFATRLDALFIEPQQFWPAEYDAKTETNEALTYKLWSELYRVTSEKQKAYFAKRLKGYEKDVAILQR